MGPENGVMADRDPVVGRAAMESDLVGPENVARHHSRSSSAPPQ